MTSGRAFRASAIQTMVIPAARTMRRHQPSALPQKRPPLLTQQAIIAATSFRPDLAVIDQRSSGPSTDAPAVPVHHGVSV